MKYLSAKNKMWSMFTAVLLTVALSEVIVMQLLPAVLLPPMPVVTLQQTTLKLILMHQGAMQKKHKRINIMCR